MSRPESIRSALENVRGRWDRVWAHYGALPPLQRRLAAAAAALVLLVLVAQGILAPLDRSVRALDERIKAAEIRALETQKSIGKKPKIEEAYRRVAQSLDLSATTDEQVRASMLQDVEGFAREAQMNLSDVRPQVSADRKGYKEVTVRLQAEGTLDQLMHFLAALVRTRRLYVIDSFQITPHPEDVHKIRANVTVARAFFPPNTIS